MEFYSNYQIFHLILPNSEFHIKQVHVLIIFGRHFMILVVVIFRMVSRSLHSSQKGHIDPNIRTHSAVFIVTTIPVNEWIHTFHARESCLSHLVAYCSNQYRLACCWAISISINRSINSCFDSNENVIWYLLPWHFCGFNNDYASYEQEVLNGEFITFL